MEWLSKNAKKIVGLVAVLIGLVAGGVSLAPGCSGTVKTLLDAKKGVEQVEPLVPGEPLPEGVK